MATKSEHDSKGVCSVHGRVIIENECSVGYYEKTQSRYFNNDNDVNMHYACECCVV